MTEYLLTLKNGTQTKVWANSFTEAVEGTTIGREQIANCQELGIEHPDNAAGS